MKKKAVFVVFGLLLTFLFSCKPDKEDPNVIPFDKIRARHFGSCAEFVIDSTTLISTVRSLSHNFVTVSQVNADSLTFSIDECSALTRGQTFYRDFKIENDNLAVYEFTKNDVNSRTTGRIIYTKSQKRLKVRFDNLSKG
jgi:hypothetical protein